MQKAFIIGGALLMIIGILWPWLAKLPIGRLPGDIIISKPGLKLYIPITTMVMRATHQLAAMNQVCHG